MSHPELPSIEPIPNWRDYSLPALPPLLQAAAECFVESGYHGTSIRTIAARAGLSVPGYYHHYGSKQVILVDIMRSAMAELYGRSIGARNEAGDDFATLFTTHIECLVLFHAQRQGLAFIAATEIRSLSPVARDEHIAARDRQQKLLEEIVAQGGDYLASSHPDAVRALITMCTGVSQWYRLGGPLAPHELAAQYVTYAWRMLGALGSPPQDGD